MLILFILQNSESGRAGEAQGVSLARHKRRLLLLLRALFVISGEALRNRSAFLTNLVYWYRYPFNLVHALCGETLKCLILYFSSSYCARSLSSLARRLETGQPI
jgi:hypothetical protein